MSISEKKLLQVIIIIFYSFNILRIQSLKPDSTKLYFSQVYFCCPVSHTMLRKSNNSFIRSPV